MLAFLLELLANLLFDVLLQVVAEMGVQAVGQGVFGAVLGDAQKVSRWWASVGQIALGLLAGGVSLLLLPVPVFRPSPLPGVSLLMAPLATGSLMQLLGNYWQAQRGWRPALFTTRAGALFAFGMAVVRFVYGS